MRFVYIGPPGEQVAATVAFGLEWVTGVPRDVSDPDIAARCGKHPHFRLVNDEAGEAGAGDESAPVSFKRRGRPPGVKHGGAGRV